MKLPDKVPSAMYAALCLTRLVQNKNFPINYTDQQATQTVEGLFPKTTTILGEKKVYSSIEKTQLIGIASKHVTLTQPHLTELAKLRGTLMKIFKVVRQT